MCPHKYMDQIQSRKYCLQKLINGIRVQSVHVNLVSTSVNFRVFESSVILMEAIDSIADRFLLVSSKSTAVK